MFYISEIYNHNKVPVVEATYSDISLVVVRNTNSDFYREFTCSYDINKEKTKIAGVDKRYLHAFNQYEVKLLQMMTLCGIGKVSTIADFQRLVNNLQFDYISDYGVFTLFNDTMSVTHYTVLDLINTPACYIKTIPDYSAYIYIYCYFRNDFIKYFVQDYNKFLLLYTKYNVLMKGKR